jgi:hypothetical protein
MKVVIYTAMFGEYDTLKDPIITHPNVDFVYFSEKKLDHLTVWQYKKPIQDFSCPIKNNRYHKMHPHLLFANDLYEASVYLDANIFIVDSFICDRAIELVKNNITMALVNHPERYCSFQELETVLLYKLISTETYKKTHQFLNSNFSKNQGLFEANLIFRNHHDDSIQTFCVDWWNSFLKLCNRDQVLLPFYLKKHGIRPDLFFISPLKNTRNHPSLIVIIHQKPPKKLDADHSILKENYIIPKVWHLPINAVLKYHMQVYLNYVVLLDEPRTFNEHINALKQITPNSFQTQLSDKLAVKSLIQHMPFNIHTPKTLCVGDHLDEILDHDLPTPFMLKANHSSGDTWCISDKTNISTQLKKTINASITRPYGDATFEPNYLNIPRFLFAEEYLPGPLLDFKVFVFNGQPKLIQVNIDRDTNHTRCFYDTQWVKQPYSLLKPLYNGAISKPTSLDLMLKASAHIGQHFRFVRVDFYDVDGLPYLGEVTFFPEAGYGSFSDLKYDYLIGQYFI